MTHYTQTPLSELLKHKDATVQRHAKGIEARMHTLELQGIEYTFKCAWCNASITEDEYTAWKICLECYKK